MIRRTYFMSAKCTDSTGYCYMNRTGVYSSILPSPVVVFDMFVNDVKKELLKTRPDGQFEVISFNRI